ncbi:MAG: glycosyltransferase family 2 protein [Chloroflexota bacterium]
MAQSQTDPQAAAPRWTPPGVTIVIPNWNHEFVLPRSIRSALQAVRSLREQGVPAEILVIDDGSRDGSHPLLRQLEALYFEQGLQVALLPKNGGVVNLRNIALSLVHYRYIVFMDADNELIPENLHVFYRSIVATEAAVVYGDLIHHHPVSGYINLYSNASFQSHMFNQNYIDTFALYDAAQIADVGGYKQAEAIDGHEDWELFLHLAALGRKLVFVPVVFGIYYELPQSNVKNARDRKPERDLYAQRVFDQFGVRQLQPLRTRHLRYHPDIGYL